MVVAAIDDRVQQQEVPKLSHARSLLIHRFIYSEFIHTSSAVALDKISVVLQGWRPSGCLRRTFVDGHQRGALTRGHFNQFKIGNFIRINHLTLFRILVFLTSHIGTKYFNWHFSIINFFICAFCVVMHRSTFFHFWFDINISSLVSADTGPLQISEKSTRLHTKLSFIIPTGATM